MEVKSTLSEHIHCFNICECGKVRLPGHIHVFNKCACGAIKLKKAGKRDGGDGGAFAKDTTDRKAGAAFTAIGITEVQADVSEEIATDRAAVSDNLGRMQDTVKSISNDVKDLAKYLKGNASAMKKLQSIQESLNTQIGKALKSEKAKMALKQERLNELEDAMRQIEKNQKCIKASFMAGKAAQFLVCLILLWGIICPILYQTGVLSGPNEKK
eukprot:g2887.t1